MERKMEYGGYLPLELREGPDWFSRCGDKNVLRVNSAKAAIFFAVQRLGIQKLYVPHYQCASVKNMLRAAGIELSWYYLDGQLLPKLSGVEKDAAVLLVNYYGVMEERVRKMSEAFGTVLLDQAHGFFAEPFSRPGAYHIYSCRKFFGVPDGGYLVGDDAAASGEPLPDEVSAQFSYLVTSREHGTNAAYREKQESDRYFCGNYRGMSRITRGMLSSVDHESVRKRRSENFAALHGLLRKANRLELPEEAAPAFLYPFWPREGLEPGADMKQRLVAEKIYVPTLWRELIMPEFAGTLEYSLSENVVFLPVDQRYTARDMEFLAQRVLEPQNL